MFLVIAIDMDPCKIKLAQNNAKIYGVADKIEFIVGNFFEISSMLKADVICMSPPWGGPEYLIDSSFSIASMCKNYKFGGFTIFDIVKNIAPSIAFHIPKTTNILEVGYCYRCKFFDYNIFCYYFSVFMVSKMFWKSGNTAEYYQPKAELNYSILRRFY